MHFINLMVNYLDRKDWVPINNCFPTIWPEVQAILKVHGHVKQSIASLFCGSLVSNVRYMVLVVPKSAYTKKS